MNILEAEILQPMELWLVDIDFPSLQLVTTIYKYGILLHKKKIEVHSTIDRKKALKGADYILISISVGMQKSEWYDIHIPLKFGIPQNTGDTVGPGGIFRGIRTIPIIYDIMRDIEALCPNSIVFNYTNPQGTSILSSYQAAPKVQSIGLCHEFFYIGSKEFARYLKYCGIKVTPENRFKILYGGVNHFSWIQEFRYGEKDIYPLLREKAFEGYKSKKFGRPFNFYLLNKSGLLNYVEDRHVAEFIPQYYNFFNHNERPFGITKLRDVQKINFERHLIYSIFKLANISTSRWIIKLFIRPWAGGEKALMMIKDKEQNVLRHHVSNVLNKNIIPSLPENCIIEVPAFFHDNQIKTPPMGSFPKDIQELIKIHAENQQLVVNAAISGRPEDLLKALLADPMCKFIEDDDKIEAMMWNMLHYERKWMHNFTESIPTHEDLKKMHYHIEKSELRTQERAIQEKYVPDPSLKKKSWPILS